VFTLFKTRSYNLTLISSLFADGIHRRHHIRDQREGRGGISERV